MLILGIETSLPSGFIVLGKEDEILASFTLPAKSSSREIVVAIKNVFEKTGLDVRKLDVIAVTRGPGSFTGSRVGISCAKALSFSLGVPVVGISTIDLIAFSLPVTESLCVLVPGYGGCFFAGFFFHKNGKMERKGDYLFLPLDKIKDMAKKLTEGKMVFVSYPHLSSGRSGEILEVKVNLPAGLLRWAKDEIKLKKFDDPFSLSPLYVSPPITGRIENG
ncbi:tRNA (adenosine(37)-N6)-threonylcarbamoyltransferase complex dimerization subunit type 1 TsaB [Candidatus Aerophobetes bacterium]|nr:tRNA (adenosine(37)-N6)-threonylcarbamoyltransferase complex dimerization subunit type 1 TsaB [Candidatus Aerophobetes bacterium]